MIDISSSAAKPDDKKLRLLRKFMICKRKACFQILGLWSDLGDVETDCMGPQHEARGLEQQQACDICYRRRRLQGLISDRYGVILPTPKRDGGRFVRASLDQR